MAVAEFYKNGSPAVTNPPSYLTNGFFTFLWVVSGVATVVGPLIYRSMKTGNYQLQNIFQMYNWEEVQQQYQANQEQYYQYYQQNGQGEGSGDSGDYQYQYQYEEQVGNYDINHCKWYQFNCFPYYINENGQPEPSSGWYPSWFSGWTVPEEQREQMMEDGETSPALVFIYVWQILMFLIILGYGLIVIRQNRVVTGVIVALVVFANMSFLALWMLADGSIITDGDYIQADVGFFGQFPVLMFMTNASYVVFGIVFSAIFAIRSHYMHDSIAPVEKQPKATEESYKAMEADSPPKEDADSPPKKDAPPLIV